MIPDKGMKLHWFFTHISAILGTVLNGIYTIVYLLRAPETAWYLLDALFSGAACWACIMSFLHRKEYTYKEFTYCVVIWWLMVAYSTLTCMVSGDTIAFLLGKLIVYALVLIYYYRRKYIFTDGRYIYTDSNTVQPVTPTQAATVQNNTQLPASPATEVKSSNQPITRDVSMNHDTKSILLAGMGIKPSVTKVVPDLDAEEQILFCHKCGYRLKPDSIFCSKCGTRIEH